MYICRLRLRLRLLPTRPAPRRRRHLIARGPALRVVWRLHIRHVIVLLLMRLLMRLLLRRLMRIRILPLLLHLLQAWRELPAAIRSFVSEPCGLAGVSSDARQRLHGGKRRCGLRLLEW